ncbi:hypothetical protein [Shinella sp.]|uniref:hypothetical protein n=1 Tax=Shinella sp. TaxID=1870904 RepID=UPI0040351B96
MTLDVVVLACACARDCRQRCDGQGVYGGIDEDRFCRSAALALRTRKRCLDLVPLLLQLVKLSVEGLDMGVAVKEALGDLSGNDILCAGDLLQSGLELLLVSLACRSCRFQLLVDLVLNRCGVVGR